MIIEGNDIVDNLIDDKALINVNTTETTEVTGEAGIFVQDAKEEKTTTTSSYARCINAQHVN
jgi:hypothetical protein